MTAKPFDEITTEKSRRELDEFCEYWKRRGRFKPKVTGTIMCQVKIRYEFGRVKVSAKTSVTIQRDAQPSGGKVSLDEAKKLPQDILHLEFLPNFQRYRFGKRNHALWIRGKNSKMGGPYRVRLRPVKATTD